MSTHDWSCPANRTKGGHILSCVAVQYSFQCSTVSTMSVQVPREKGILLFLHMITIMVSFLRSLNILIFIWKLRQVFSDAGWVNNFHSWTTLSLGAQKVVHWLRGNAVFGKQWHFTKLSLFSLGCQLSFRLTATLSVIWMGCGHFCSRLVAWTNHLSFPVE